MALGDDSREIRALRQLHELMTAVNSVDRVDVLLQTVVQGVVDVLGFQMAVIDVLDEHDMLEVVAAAGDDGGSEALLGRRIPLASKTVEFDVAECWGTLRFVPHDKLPAEATTSWVPDIEPLDTPDAWHPLDALYALLQDPSGRLLGVLGVDLPLNGRRPSLLRRQVLEMYAVQAGLAIHQAQSRARLTDRVALGDATREIAAAPAAWMEADSILDHSLQPLATGYRCDRLWVATFDEAAGDPQVSVGATHPPALAVRLGAAEVEALRRVGESAWEARRAVVIGGHGDSTADVLEPAALAAAHVIRDALGGGQLLVSPLGAGTEVAGCLVLGRDDAAEVWSGLEAEGATTLGQEVGRVVMQARLYETQRRLNEELRELDRYKNELMGTITHELKAPLTVIDGHVELLEEQGADDHSIRAIRRGTQRLQRLVEDLLLLARVKDSRVPLERHAVDLTEVLAELEDLHSVEVRRRDLTLRLPRRHPDQPVLAWGDRDELARAMLNIVGNAVKYTPDGGEVTIRVSGLGETAEFVCTDTGIGIDPADQHTLFEEFNRSSNPDAHRIPGTGLGLAIVKRIVERHQGTISLESARGLGSTFRIVVPAPPVVSEASPLQSVAVTASRLVRGPLAAAASVD